MVAFVIPEQLKHEKFVKTTTEKKPIEPEWTTKNNYTYQDFQPSSSTYGVLCGHNGLIVLDCDSKETQDKLFQIKEIRETFTVKTAGKGLYHFYFKTDKKEPETIRIDDHRGNRILDVQGAGTQVIGPRSKIGDNEYTIENPQEIATIKYDFLKEILVNTLDNAKVITKKKKNDEIDEEYIEFDETIYAIKQKIKPKDLLTPQAQKQNPTQCPLGHTSEGGQCFHHTGNVWYCHHCMQTGNVFHLYMKLHSCNFQTAKIKLAAQAGLINNFQEKVFKLFSKSETRKDAIELIAREFLKFNNIYTLRDDKESEMWIYKNGIYVPNAKTYVKEYVYAVLESSYTIEIAKKIINLIEVKTYIEYDEFFKENDPYKIPLRNGIYNIHTKKLEDYNTQDKYFTKLPIIYDPLMQPEKITQFFHDVLKDDKEVQVIQEICGFLLFREYFIEKAFMFLGSGRNGKSKTLEIMRKLIGPENCCSVSIQSLETDKFATFNLHNKMGNIVGDLPKKGLENTARFKELVGRDTAQGDRKFLKTIYFKNYAKMIFAANELPTSYDATDGFYDRWIIIDFPYKFVENPTEPHHKKINPNIIEELVSHKEMSGLFNWALEGLHRLQKDKKFSISSTTQEIKKRWERKSSSVKSFIFDEVTIDYANKDAYVSVKDFYAQYYSYCNKHGKKPDAKSEVSRALNENGLQQSVRNVNGVSTRVFPWVSINGFENEEQITVEDLQ